MSKWKIFKWEIPGEEIGSLSSTFWGFGANSIHCFCGERHIKLSGLLPCNKLLSSGFLLNKKLQHYDLASKCFSHQEKHTSQINTHILICDRYISVNQKIIKVLIHFSVVSLSVSKRSNHFCFNNKIKFLGTCVCYSVGGRDKYFCP